MAPSCRMAIGLLKDEDDHEYVPPCTEAPKRATRTNRGTSKKVASGVITASQSDEKRTLTGKPSRYDSGF